MGIEQTNRCHHSTGKIMMMNMMLMRKNEVGLSFKGLDVLRENADDNDSDDIG